MNFKKDNNKGIAIIFIILIIFILLFLAFYFLSFSTIEKRIAKSQTAGLQAYYLAEAGVNEMIWLIKNDSTYRNNFEFNPSNTSHPKKFSFSILIVI